MGAGDVAGDGKPQAAAAGLQIAPLVEAMERAELIRATQLKEGHSPCFGSDWCKPEWREACMWKDECGAKIFIE